MGKRGFTEFDSPVQTCKRTCQLSTVGGQAHGSQAVRQEEVLAFLQQIGVQELAQDPSSSRWTESAVSEQAWVCVAELNLLLAAYRHRFSELVLRSYSSFTRGSKAGVFGKLVASYNCGHPGADGLTASTSHLPIHLQVTSVLLQHAFRHHPEGAATVYGFAPPSWLWGWCKRWGFSNPTLTVLALEGYPGLVRQAGHAYSLGEAPRHVSSSPAVTLYVPQFPC